MTVEHRDPYALAGDNGTFGLYYLISYYLSEYLKRLLFRFFLFTADIWDNVFNHLGPVAKSLARA